MFLPCIFRFVEYSDVQCISLLCPSIRVANGACVYFARVCRAIVSDAEHKTCSEAGSIQLNAVEGYLSSYTAQELGHGAASCPWIITVKPGQKIKLTLMDFSIASRYKADNNAQPPPGAVQPPAVDSDDGGQGETSDYCHLYATVSEHGGGASKKKQQQQHVCAKNTREYVAYASTSNSVAIELSEHIMTDSSVSFIIKFSGE